jgi:hypothetical protein
VSSPTRVDDALRCATAASCNSRTISYRNAALALYGTEIVRLYLCGLKPTQLSHPRAREGNDRAGVPSFHTVFECFLDLSNICPAFDCRHRRDGQRAAIYPARPPRRIAKCVEHVGSHGGPGLGGDDGPLLRIRVLALLRDEETRAHHGTRRSESEERSEVRATGESPGREYGRSSSRGRKGGQYLRNEIQNWWSGS